MDQNPPLENHPAEGKVEEDQRMSPTIEENEKAEQKEDWQEMVERPPLISEQNLHEDTELSNKRNLVAQLRMENAQKAQELDKKRETIKTLDSNIEQVNQEIEAKNSEKKEQDEHIKDLEQRIVDVGRLTLDKEKKAENLKTRMESLARTNADKKRELELMQSQFKEIESQAKLSRKVVAQKQAEKEFCHSGNPETARSHQL